MPRGRACHAPAACMMRQIVEVADKSVSTDDLVPQDGDEEALRKSILDVARLETVLAALVESKVVAIRHENEKTSSNHSSPIALLASRIHRTFHSNSTVSSGRLGKHKLSVENVEGLTRTGENDAQDVQRPKRRGRPHHHQHHQHHHEEIEESGERSRQSPARCWHETESRLISPPGDMCGIVPLDGCLGEECVVVLERERPRTRTRRKRRRRRHKHDVTESLDERVKVLDPDELPQRARWTIMVTACLLLFLCLLLVGVTLRMAPLIDDMVRQENERMMHESFNIGLPNSSQSTMAEHKSVPEHPRAQ